MVNAIENSELNEEARCLVRRFNNPHDKATINNTFDFTINTNKTVRQFIHIVAQYYNLDVDTFYLTFSSYKSDSTSETVIGNKVFVTETLKLCLSFNELIYY